MVAAALSLAVFPSLIDVFDFAWWIIIAFNLVWPLSAFVFPRLVGFVNQLFKPLVEYLADDSIYLGIMSLPGVARDPHVP
jgi:hypothetical protein